MANRLKLRVAQLESRMNDAQEIAPGMVYITPMETLEDVEANYERHHGYKRHEDTPMIRIECIDMRKNIVDAQ